ncbi:MAG TPA: hypothetical protein VF284_06905 [Rhodanobacteraceae bacterium]
MELIGSCEVMDCTVEAYFPEPGKEDVWTLWVVKDGRVVHEVEIRMDVASPYGIDHPVLAALERAAVRAVEAAIRKTRPRRGRGFSRLAAA